MQNHVKLTKLNPLAFKLMMAAYVGFILTIIASSIVMIVTLNAQVDIIIDIFHAMGTYDMMRDVFPNLENMIRGIFIASTVISLTIGVLYHALMIRFMLKHRKNPRRGRYLIVMAVLNSMGVMGGFWNIYTFVMSFHVSMITTPISFLLCIIALAGVIIQLQKPLPDDFGREQTMTQNPNSFNPNAFNQDANPFNHDSNGFNNPNGVSNNESFDSNNFFNPNDNNQNNDPFV